jgi:predicted metalloprotease with PDZ domain
MLLKKPNLTLILALLPLLAGAQNSAPNALPITNTIPEPRDVAYPGTITISVDASDNVRGIYRVHETIPVPNAGPFVLLYPKWLPGHHSDGGTLSSLAGITFKAGNTTLKWHRDTVDVFAFHIDIPEGVKSIEAQYQFLGATDTTQGRIMATPEMLSMEWNTVALYPAGYYVRRINFDPSVKLPEGWKPATALEVASQDGATTHYKPVPFDVLVDSPMLAGANTRFETIAPNVRLDIVADTPEELAATEEQLVPHRNLVTQAVKLFGAQHYNHYDFLFSLSARLGSVGLEHHRSSEDGVSGGYFSEWNNSLTSRNLLPHEYTHSWNGKFRRPEDLWTPDYRTPMQDSLLWVYEGQTQFWGYVLGARSGLMTQDQTLGALASIAARLDTDAGRQWRPLEDTTDDPIIAQRRPKGWRSYQRSEDYYNEGMLVWLDADSLIREQSHGAKSLDDFAKAFFGVKDGDWGELTYNFNDLVTTLNQVQPYDWATFLHTRLDNTSTNAPLDGFTRGGYKLVYTDTPNEFAKASEKERHTTDLTYSVGFSLGRDGDVTEVAWDGPAFNAGLTVASKIIAVNGHTLDTDQLKAAIKAKKPIKLLVKTGDIYRTIDLNYTGGLRYPKFEKTGTGPSSLEALLTPKP